MAITFSSRADGSVIADFSGCPNEGDLDTLAIDAAPGRDVGDVIRFSQDEEGSKGRVRSALVSPANGVYAVVNGVAEYEVVSVGPTEYTVRRLAT